MDNVIIIFKYVVPLEAHKDNNQPILYIYIIGIEL